MGSHPLHNQGTYGTLLRLTSLPRLNECIGKVSGEAVTLRNQPAEPSMEPLVPSGDVTPEPFH